jgi:hypothetical protein
MFFDLFIAVLLNLLGAYTFGPFGTNTPIIHKIVKLAFYLGLVALVSWLLGPPWGTIAAIGLLTVGLTVHFWWCRKNGIHPLRAEPREKYYRLRGWS